MANYRSIVLDQAANQWLLSLLDEKIDSWAKLKQVFASTYKSTCKQLGTKYNLEWLKARSSEPLHTYICHFLEARITVTDNTDTEVISTFIGGLEHHDDLQKKLHCKKVKMVTELLEIAQKFAGQDEVERTFQKD